MSTGYGWEGISQVCATLLGARHVHERLCGGPCLQRGAITSVRPFLTFFPRPDPLNKLNLGIRVRQTDRPQRWIRLRDTEREKDTKRKGNLKVKRKGERGRKGVTGWTSWVQSTYFHFETKMNDQRSVANPVCIRYLLDPIFCSSLTVSSSPSGFLVWPK